jgi:uncharacterized protein (UPF0276 family)
VRPGFSFNDNAGRKPIPATAGIGLRLPHHGTVLGSTAAIDWLEVHPENYMTQGVVLEELDAIVKMYPLSLHSVGLSLGSVGAPDCDHLKRLRRLVERYQPALVSDHLSWSAFRGTHFPDLLPLPYTRESLQVFATNVDRVQSQLRRNILVENPSTYGAVPHSVMSEALFLSELVDRTGCGILLDLNNIYVSALNAGKDPQSQLEDYLAYLPRECVGEIHLAGHLVTTAEDGSRLYIDNHGAAVCPDVWRLFRVTIEALGARPTLIEWDSCLPPLEVLQAQAATAQSIMETADHAETAVC